MDKRLRNVLLRHGSKFEHWYENIVYYQEQFILPYNPYWEEKREQPLDIEVLLRQILEIFVGYAGKQGTWKWHESLDYGTGFSTGIVSQEMDHSYILGVTKDSIYLESPIACPESIHKMFDRFVQAVSDFSRFGVFRYSENQCFDDTTLRQYRALLKKKFKGQLAELLRSYFIAKAEFEANFDFGFLEVRWPLDKFSFDQFVVEGCAAFKIIHDLNIQLWKKSKARQP